MATKEYPISLPQTYTVSMTTQEAAARTAAAKLVKGVKFSIVENPNTPPYRVAGETVIADTDALTTYNKLLDSLIG
jgi:hypothetical protein